MNGLRIERQGRLAVLRMDKARGNAIDEPLVEALARAAAEVAEADGFEAACLARLEEFADKDPFALATTKAWLREGVLAEMMAHEGDRVGAFLDAWFSEGTQQRIRTTVASLKAKG
jgi:hypothetical protein